MAYPERQFQHAPSNPSHSGRPGGNLPQQQHLPNQRSYHHSSQDDRSHDRPHDVAFRQGRTYPETINAGPRYNSNQSSEYNAEWLPAVTPPYSNSREAPRLNQYQYQQQDQYASWSSRSPHMAGQRQQFHRPSERDLNEPPVDDYDLRGLHPRMNGHHGLRGVREVNSLLDYEPESMSIQQQRPLPGRDRGVGNVKYYGQDPRDGSGQQRPPKPASGRFEIQMDPISSESMSWDNPFPTFPTNKKLNEHDGTDNLNQAMGEMKMGNRSNVRQANSPKPSAAASETKYEYLQMHKQQYLQETSRAKRTDDYRVTNPNKPTGERSLPNPPDQLEPDQHPFYHAVNSQVETRQDTNYGWQSQGTTGDLSFRQPGAYQGDSPRSKTMPNTISEAMMDSYPLRPYGGHPQAQDVRNKLMSGPASRNFQGPRQSQFSRTPMHATSRFTDYRSTNQHQEQEQWTLDPRPQHSQQSSLGDFFDSYYHSPHHSESNVSHKKAGSSSAPLDEDMPNFDIVPEADSFHKRDLSIDAHLYPQQKAPALPLMPFQSHLPISTRSPPLSGSTEGLIRSKSSPNLQEQGWPRTHQYSDGFNFELPGSVPAMYSPGPSPGREEYDGTKHIDVQHQASSRGNKADNPSQIYASPRQALGQAGTGESYDGRPFPRPPDEQSRPSIYGGRPSQENPTQAIYNGPSPARRVGPRSPPVDPQGNLDTLAPHPIPVRAGLIHGPPKNQPSRPTPVRQYSGSASSHSQTSSTPKPQISRPPREKSESAAVTHEGLERLRHNIRKNPSDSHAQLLLAKKLAEAATVLSEDGGRADAKMTTKNHEKFVSEAYKVVKKLVQSGHPEAMFYLGDCYSRGSLGLESDSKEAFGQYQSAAKAGHAQAAYRVAVCCEMGLEEGGGTKRDAVKAMQWYHRAATLGDTPAMYKMGVIQLKGLLGQPKNANAALSWLQRAAAQADQENPHAVHELVSPRSWERWCDS